MKRVDLGTNRQMRQRTGLGSDVSLQFGAYHGVFLSSQRVSEPRALSAALYAAQFVVW